MSESRTFKIAFADGDSSFIKGIERIDNDLIVEFKNDKGYRYFNVPEKLVEDFIVAESYGKFLHKHLKDKYKGEPIE